MFNILKMFSEKETPIGLSSLGLSKTGINRTHQRLKNISSHSPIFSFDYAILKKDSIKVAY
ncbi:MAG: hypothetical protein PHC34_00345 [Candidatus Gastranaerophilales bacterium]|nr:hypothetical protein [Candidatus Gastranaerophilales bacterium]